MPWDHPSARALRDAQQVELRARYGDDGTPEPPPEHVLVTVLLTVDETAVGCGSLKDLSGAVEHGPGVAEVKRVFVDPAWRGRGYSRLVMRELGSWAATAGLRRLVLETGLQQPEAIGLYLSLGYTSIPNYGEWAGVADSRCFALALGLDRTAGGERREGRSRGLADGRGHDDRPLGALTVETVELDHPEAAGLRERMYRESVPVYPEIVAQIEAAGGFTVVDAALGPQMLVTVLARLDGTAVGCASLARPHGLAEGDPARTGELRRVYVSPGARRTGAASALVRALEVHARDLGLDTVLLTTGIRQPAAVALYRRLGYRPVLPFGDWRDDPLGLYLGRRLHPTGG
ncbi:MAG TPA: GNAT family N-acetyltransferase [Cellulomonas sp.]